MDPQGHLNKSFSTHSFIGSASFRLSNSRWPKRHKIFTPEGVPFAYVCLMSDIELESRSWEQGMTSQLKRLFDLALVLCKDRLLLPLRQPGTTPLFHLGFADPGAETPCLKLLVSGPSRDTPHYGHITQDFVITDLQRGYRIHGSLLSCGIAQVSPRYPSRTGRFASYRFASSPSREGETLQTPSRGIWRVSLRYSRGNAQ